MGLRAPLTVMARHFQFQTCLHQHSHEAGLESLHFVCPLPWVEPMASLYCNRSQGRQLAYQLRQIARPAARHSAASQDGIHHKRPHGDEGWVLAQHL